MLLEAVIVTNDPISEMRYQIKEMGAKACKVEQVNSSPRGALWYDIRVYWN